MKPVIGISGSIIINNGNSFLGYKRSYVNQDYVESVLRAGGIPFIIPFNEDIDTTKEMISKVDGLILSGGHDVDPANYGEEPLIRIGEIFPERDLFDSILYKSAIEQGKPIFGICRGFQLINVLNGGTLYQDLSYADFVKIKHNQGDNPTQLIHSVEISEGSFLAKIFEKTQRVNSFHHQIIKEVADDFNISAKSPDGVIEAIEKIDDKNFIIGIQWHPEMISGRYENFQRIFNEFVKEVKERR